MLLLAIASLPGMAATDTPDLARIFATSGAAQANKALESLLAATPERKLAYTLAKSGLGNITMPVTFARGAELSLSDPTPMGACAWSEGTLSCHFDAARAAPSEYRVSCRTGYGASAPLASSETAASAGRIAFVVRGVEACWKLDGVGVSVEPIALQDLEGVGQGTEFIPPELVLLDKREVDAILQANAPMVQQVCVRRASEEGKHVGGTIVVGYHIGSDGSIERAWIESATARDEGIEACMLERMKRIRIRPPMGGYEGGTFTFTFL